MSLFTVDIQTLLGIWYTVEVPSCTTLSIVHEDRIDNTIIMCLVLKLKSALLNYHQKYSFTNPIVIFDVHVSSFLDKTFHCVVTAFAGCNMQGSPLIEESNKF